MSNQITEIVQIVATMLAAFGLFLTAYQISRTVKEKRIDRVDKVRQLVFGDSDVSDIYYQLEYGSFVYDENFHGSKTEIQLDKLLCLFDTLAKQVEMKLLNMHDLDLVAYEYLVIYHDKGIQSYLNFLDSWTDTRGLKRPQFEAFRKIGILLENEHS